MHKERKTSVEERDAVKRIETPLIEGYALVADFSSEEAEKRGIFIRKGERRENILDMGVLIDPAQSTFFYLGPRMRASPEGNVVEVNLETLVEPKKIFALLHELGHILDYRKKLENRQKVPDMMVLALRDPNDAKTQQEILQLERNAWANAIRLARKIKKEYAIDLFKLFRDSDEFMTWIRRNGLGTYEAHLENLGVKAFTKIPIMRRFDDRVADEAIKEWKALREEERREIDERMSGI